MSVADAMEHWRVLEADFWRYYRAEPLRLPWRKFITFLAGLPSDSTFLAMLEINREETDWRTVLGRATGRDYHANKTMDLDTYLARHQT